MLQVTETVIEKVEASYAVQAPDTSQITAVVTDGNVTVTYGGTSMVLPLECLTSVTGLLQGVLDHHSAPEVTQEIEPELDDTVEMEDINADL